MLRMPESEWCQWMCVELLERHNNVRELQRIQSSFRLRKVFGDRNVHKMLPTDGERLCLTRSSDHNVSGGVYEKEEAGSR